MFVQRDTGARRYFEVSLDHALGVFQGAYRQVSGLVRTVRGPSMSTEPGKVLVNGVTEIRGEKVFALQFLQAREPGWVGRPFFARWDPDASWLSDLRPAFGESEFFFEREFDEMRRAHHARRWRVARHIGPASQLVRPPDDLEEMESA
jgi:hypothetical protein